MTATELAAKLGPVMGLMPKWFDQYLIGDALAEPGALIAEAVLTRWLIGEGYHSFDWCYNSDLERVELSLYDDEPYWGKTHLDSLIAATLAAGGGE